MKQILLYLLLLGITIMIPVNGIDIGKLRPVQVIEVYGEDGKCVIETDTGDKGGGETPEEALKDLKATTPAVIYLDTADYLLIGEDMEEEIFQLEDRFGKRIRVCRVDSRLDLKEAAEYLKIHRDLPTLKAYKNGESLPILEPNGGRIKILQKNEKYC